MKHTIDKNHKICRRDADYLRGVPIRYSILGCNTDIANVEIGVHKSYVKIKWFEMLCMIFLIILFFLRNGSLNVVHNT